MAWEITFDNEGEKVVVNLDDLSPSVFEEIAKPELATFWAVYSYPAQTPDRLHAVISAAARHAGIEPPPKAETMRAANELNDMIGEATPIEDQPIVDGLPQVPGATESGSTSGAPGDSTGTESSADDSP